MITTKTADEDSSIGRNDVVGCLLICVPLLTSALELIELTAAHHLTSRLDRPLALLLLPLLLLQLRSGSSNAHRPAQDARGKEANQRSHDVLCRWHEHTRGGLPLRSRLL